MGVRHLVVVLDEPLIDAELRVQDDGRDGGPRRVSVGRQRLGEGLVLRAQTERVVGPGPVVIRVQPRHDRRVRRQRRRRRRDGL